MTVSDQNKPSSGSGPAWIPDPATAGIRIRLQQSVGESRSDPDPASGIRIRNTGLKKNEHYTVQYLILQAARRRCRL